MKFSVLSQMQNVTEQISKSAGKLFLFATSPFCFTSAPAQLPAVSNGSIGGLSGPSFSLTGGAQINMKGARTISPPFSLVFFYWNWKDPSDPKSSPSNWGPAPVEGRGPGVPPPTTVDTAGRTPDWASLLASSGGRSSSLPGTLVVLTLR